MQIFENPRVGHRGVPGGMRRVRGGEEGEEERLDKFVVGLTRHVPPAASGGLAGGAAD